MYKLSEVKENKKLSTMMKHYASVKERYPDCIVFYRLGDFYEMFFEDAVEASKVLDLTLTGRDCGLPERAPMCGVPFHAANVYIAKLVAEGYKVAVCEQLSEPDGKNPVDRDVIRVITSGTVTDNDQIDEKTNNFICSVFGSDDKYGIAYSDITTGDFVVAEVKGDDALGDILTRIDPAEIIVNQKNHEKLCNLPVFTHGVIVRPAAYKEYAFTESAATENICKQFKVHSFAALELDKRPLAVRAAGALLEYFSETQMRALSIISSVKIERDGERMILDANCLRNLEIVRNMRDGKTRGSLLFVLDHTCTAMGARLMHSIFVAPLKNKAKIEYRLDGVEELFKNMPITAAIRETLSDMRDIERIAGRLSNDVISPKDMEVLRQSLELIPEIKFRLSGLSTKALTDVNAHMKDLSDVTDLLRKAIIENAPALAREGGFIREGFDEELDKLKNIHNNGKSVIADIEARERERTGIKNLRVGFNKVFGYYIEVTNSFKDKVPYDYVRKQTLTGAERYITEELKTFEEQVLTSADRALAIEVQIFAKLKAFLMTKMEDLKSVARAVASLDVLCSLAYVAKKNNYCKPEITDGNGRLDICGGRHPVVENAGNQFIANDTLLDTDENSMMIITGPNMAGKSTYMRQVALITVMAHCGSFVPARSAIVPLTDRVFTRVGASDNLLFDQSTFMVEMSEVALILRAATENSLVVLDEVGRGTSTYDGLGIAWAVVEYICNNLHAKTLFATHYHELSELEGVVHGVKNYKITVKEADGKIMFLRRIMRGSANKSFGIEVAALAGVPNGVTLRAKAILKTLEKNDPVKHVDTAEIAMTAAEEKQYSECERIIKDIDINNLTPMQAFAVLADLKEKVEKN